MFSFSMKIILLALLGAPTVLGHYLFYQTLYNGITSGQWQYIRETANNPSNAPVQDVNDAALTCYEKAGRKPSQTLSVTAGSQISFVASQAVWHAGPTLWYMARVPAGQAVDSWKPSGNVWFKISQAGDHGKGYPEFDTNMGSFNTTIPKSLPSGNYVIRGEQIGLHIAGSPQFYLSCANLAVTGGGSGSPGPLVSIPGAYKMSDPGLSVNIYTSKSPYQYPGPAVWRG